MDATDADAASPMPRDTALRQRAAKVIPGGMWGHMNEIGRAHV